MLDKTRPCAGHRNGRLRGPRRVLDKTRLALALDSAEPLRAELGAEAAALGRAAACVVHAGLDAANRMQAALLTPHALVTHHGAGPALPGVLAGTGATGARALRAWALRDQTAGVP